MIMNFLKNRAQSWLSGFTETICLFKFQIGKKVSTGFTMKHATHTPREQSDEDTRTHTFSLFHLSIFLFFYRKLLFVYLFVPWMCCAHDKISFFLCFCFFFLQSMSLLYLRLVKVREFNNWMLSVKTWQRQTKPNQTERKRRSKRL